MANVKLVTRNQQKYQTGNPLAFGLTGYTVKSNFYHVSLHSKAEAIGFQAQLSYMKTWVTSTFSQYQGYRTEPPAQLSYMKTWVTSTFPQYQGYRTEPPVLTNVFTLSICRMN